MTDGPTPTATPSPGSAAAVVEFDKGALRELVHGVLLGASHILHNYLARTDTERAQAVWIAEPDDQAAIGDPVVKVAARHGGPELANPDVADLLTAGFAVVGYGIKNVLRSMRARRADRQLAAIGPGLVEHAERPAGE